MNWNLLIKSFSSKAPEVGNFVFIIQGLLLEKINYSIYETSSEQYEVKQSPQN